MCKQFVYHKAFLEYLIKNGIQNVFNAFLFPTPSSKKTTDFIKAFGKVDMKPLMEWGLNRLPSVHLAHVNPDELEVRADYSAQQLTMVGYLKPGYVEFLHRGCSKMIFYFYHTRNGFVYPVHPHLINCKIFAGYTDGDGVIVGNIVGKLQIRTVAGRNKSYYQDAINAYPGNDITHEYSPKVVNDIK